ncbi:MAG TPA: carboxypeptidase-like regulatory domain-containing protein [archaeon]|nr:carboxypeptidase-like regulatory domain-containing protein [archaeon]
MLANRFKSKLSALAMLTTLLYLFTAATLGAQIIAPGDDDGNGEAGYKEDINQDEVTDVSDAIALLLLGQNDPESPVADYNDDGEYNIIDVISLLINMRDENLTPLPTFTITGKVLLNSQGAEGVVIVIEGGEVWKQVTTDSLGIYRFEDIPDGMYEVKPIIRNWYYSFLPEDCEVKINGNSLTLPNIEASLASNTLRGRILLDNVGLSDVTVSIKGELLDTSIVTDSNGIYRIEGLYNAPYTVVPQKENYSFTPYTFAVVLNGDSVVARDIIASPVGPEPVQVYNVTGRVICTVQPLSSVTVLVAGDMEVSTVTDANGFFYFLLPNGNYKIIAVPIPLLQVFNPVSIDFTVNGQDVGNLEFIGFGAGGIEE